MADTGTSNAADSTSDGGDDSVLTVVTAGTALGLILLALLIGDLVLFVIWIRRRRSLKRETLLVHHNGVSSKGSSPASNTYDDVESYINPVTCIVNDSYDSPAIIEPLVSWSSFKPVPPKTPEKTTTEEEPGAPELEQAKQEKPVPPKKPSTPVKREVPIKAPELLVSSFKPDPPKKPEKVTTEEEPAAPKFQQVMREKPVPPKKPTTPVKHAASVEQTKQAVPERPVVPTKPSTPEKPALQVKPSPVRIKTVRAQQTEAEKPAIPVKPAVPEKPTISAKPAVSQKPTISAKPVVPVKPVGVIKQKPALPIKPPIPVKSPAKVTKPQILSYQKTVEASEGESVLLEVKTLGVPRPSITWFRKGREVSRDLSMELTEDYSLFFPSIETGHAGEYGFTVGNSAGSTSGEVQVVVYSGQGEEEVEEDGKGEEEEGEAEYAFGALQVERFKKYVSQLHLQNGFTTQFEGLPSKTWRKDVTVGRTTQNIAQNRFRNITPYDGNCVVLTPILGCEECQNTYINASYIDGYRQEKKYIATQAPLPDTMTDFWRMVWKQGVQVIAMLTNVMEGGQRKCEQYWPDSGTLDYGPFRVTLSDEYVCPDYTVRVFQVKACHTKSGGQLKTVTQYHFTSWPATGVPQDPALFLSFHQQLRQQLVSSSGPLLVHCSAGVGRTGTLISIDIALDQAARERAVDVPSIVTKIRSQRMKIVQNPDEYTFIHDVLVEALA